MVSHLRIWTQTTCSSEKRCIPRGCRLSSPEPDLPAVDRHLRDFALVFVVFGDVARGPGVHEVHEPAVLELRPQEAARVDSV